MKDIKLRLALDKNRIHYVDINNAQISEKYYCPFCGNEVFPRALNSNLEQKHFCHRVAECKKEGIEHFMIKYFILDKDVISIEDINIYVDKTKTVIEKPYKTIFGYYKPDITLFKRNGERIFLEIKKSNSKQDDYLLKWFELKSDVLEYDIDQNKLYYLFKDNNYLGKYKQRKKQNKNIKQIEFCNYLKNIDDNERVQALANFWIECRKYKITGNENDIIDAFNNIQNFTDKEYSFYLLRDLNCTEYMKNVLKNFSRSIIINSNFEYLQDAVRLFLKLNKMSQIEFAKRMECKPSRLSRWLRGYYRFGKVYCSRVKEIIYGE